MIRIWFIIVPAALFIWALLEGGIEVAIGVGLLSFVFGTSAYLLALRLNWRWGNAIAAVVAFAGLFLSAEAYFQIRSFANTPAPVDVEPCPPDGCMMIDSSPASEPEREVYP